MAITHNTGALELPLTDALAPWFGDFAGDFDMEAIYRDYEAIISVMVDQQFPDDSVHFSWPARSEATAWYDPAVTDRGAIAAVFAQVIEVHGPGILEAVARQHELAFDPGPADSDSLPDDWRRAQDRFDAEVYGA